MTLTASGQISIGGNTTSQSIEVELGQSGSAMASLNDSNFRKLAGKSSGQISLSDFYAKTNSTSLRIMILNNQPDVVVDIGKQLGYVTGISNNLFVILNSGVRLYATKTSNAALTFINGNPQLDSVTVVLYGQSKI